MLLETRGIGLRTRAAPVGFGDGVLRLADGSTVAADAVVALPKLEGPGLEGIPRRTNTASSPRTSTVASPI